MPEDLQNLDLSCLDEANTKLQELLGESCELPLSRVRDLAQEHGIRAIDLLGRAEGSETCFVDYDTGHIRCTKTPAGEASGEG